MRTQPKNIVYTVGHSTRNFDEFFSILRTYEIDSVVDVRAVPHSRHNPQFNKETLPDSLKSSGVKYVHMPELGGRRRPNSDSINLGLRNKSFRGYADYMQTKDFVDNLLKLVALIRGNSIIVMCAEALPWRCHRILLSDALLARSIHVKHVLTENSCINHELTSFALVEGARVTYPLFVKEKPQKSLSEFI